MGEKRRFATAPYRDPELPKREKKGYLKAPWGIGWCQEGGCVYWGGVFKGTDGRWYCKDHWK